MKLVLYRDTKKQFRWRLVAKNDRVLADSGEGYKRRVDMMKALQLIFSGSARTIVDET